MLLSEGLVMKKVVILGVGNALNSLINYFRSNNFDVTALAEYEDDIFKLEKIDYLVLNNYSKKLPDNVLKNSIVIKLHPSLLPAFDECEAAKKAYLAGVKVSGLTVSVMTPTEKYFKIVAQFPVLIDFDTHFDEFEENINKTECMFYPIVIDSIIKNKPFHFSMVIGQSSCSGNCGSCGGK